MMLKKGGVKDMKVASENSRNITLKLLFDYIAALFGIVFFSPLMVYIACRIKHTDHGPIIYSHPRIGKNGKCFPCYKFRTMVLNSEEMLENYLKNNIEAKFEWERDNKLKNDPRITSIGCFLRRTSLDELPQLLNILRGEMSIVGPRPIVEEELNKYGKYLPYYLSVKPGLTGLWQVSGRNDTTYEERVAFDVEYVKNSSFWGDLIIIVKTITVVISGKGAY